MSVTKTKRGEDEIRNAPRITGNRRYLTFYLMQTGTERCREEDLHEKCFTFLS